jgi:hypothetical protein
MKNLPNEIVSIILSYEGSLLRERNGKFIKQIEKNDKRYNLLINIPKKNNLYTRNHYIDWGCNSFSICKLNNNLKIVVTEYDNKVFYAFYKNDDCMETFYID